MPVSSTIDPTRPIHQKGNHMDDKERFGYRGAHELTGISMNTLYSLVAGKRIPHKRLGPRHVLFVKSELLAWLDEHSVPSKSVAGS